MSLPSSHKNWVESEVLDSSGSYFTIVGFKMNIYVYFNAISEELLYVRERERERELLSLNKMFYIKD